MSHTISSALRPSAERLPLGALLALAMAAFITLLTEIMPAGLLSSIAEGLNVSESLAGQFITAYAVGALVAAIPVTTLTQGMRRRPLLLFAIFGFALVNLITALSSDYTVSLVARFFAGVFGGIVWSLLAGYAVRMSPSHLSGRAIAISGAGATIALVLGVPLGAQLGRYIGWQGAFGLMTALALLLIVWVLAVVPDFAGQSRDQRQSLARVFLRNGIRAVLFVVFTFVVAHNILYIYVEPFLQSSGLAAKVDVVLFIFGLGSIAGLWFVGALVDRRLQFLAVASILVFAIASLLLGIWGGIPQMVYISVAIWGLAVGGFATITQTALSRFAGESVDVAQSMYTTGWNTAVAAGGVIGGILLDRAGSGSFAWAAIGVLGASLLGTIFFMNKALARQC
ncbi:MFS transporter [Pectobacterium odoriferum]|uniref:MFS transporter n=1 Tax=Pectobacterium odoriferum TaxID=78398 RepID=UPI000A903AFE|nr:MFS transporter [Pectobacterium odoriferum]GKW03846.1 MFS transporter [Pectobacterium carotovorum subsp. carotovorum]POE17593.1 MFS transporter [Pectobacterium odoriferum]POE35060.1 MFS transporter [Pectobacterium odoriferum]GKX43489.1 MFS transporter [Pectobacterium carotovorum subsp. carotovorum]GLX55335.1 MFS transporter [Pectobacterium carotovorum subsp. carotovorum]